MRFYNTKTKKVIITKGFPKGLITKLTDEGWYIVPINWTKEQILSLR